MKDFETVFNSDPGDWVTTRNNFKITFEKYGEKKLGDWVNTLSNAAFVDGLANKVARFLIWLSQKYQIENAETFDIIIYAFFPKPSTAVDESTTVNNLNPTEAVRSSGKGDVIQTDETESKKRHLGDGDKTSHGCLQSKELVRQSACEKQKWNELKNKWRTDLQPNAKRQRSDASR
jgi:hypothetical protein